MKKSCMSSLIRDSRPYSEQSIFYMYTHLYKLKKLKLTLTLNHKGKSVPKRFFIVYSIADQNF
jgi:hypothetical protein